MTAARLAFLVLGGGLFAWLVAHADLHALVREVAALGVAGFALVLLIYATEFLCDVVSWQLTSTAFPGTARWTRRLYGVRMAGEAYNVVTPLGGMGGEPVKALILKRRFRVPYAASGASLVLAKTANVAALLLFLAVGFALLLDDPRIPGEVRALAGTGLAALGAGVAGLFLFQRLRITSRLGARLGTGHPRVQRLLGALREFDQHLVAFYTGAPARFTAVLTLGFVNWVLGAVGVWVTLLCMGQPVAFLDAWIIEAMAQMVRAATFFIPASLGAQEGVIMLVTGAVTGDANRGLAVALVRRGREVLWVLAGLALSVRYLGRLTPGAPGPGTT